MIQIKYFFQFDDNVVTKKIEFCNNHEKNLDILYEVTKENIKKKEKQTWNNFL